MVPVPVKGMFNPSVVMKTLPPAVPAVFGENLIFSVAVLPGARVKGKVGPVTENSLPVVVKAVSVWFEVLGFVTTTESVMLDPTATSPKDRLEGAAVSGSLITPVPPRPSFKLGFDALLVTVMSAPTHPVAFGAKVTLRFTL